jgi:hypothetical protein
MADNRLPVCVFISFWLVDLWCLTPLSTIISAISWRPVLFAKETGVPEENH